MGNWEFLHCVSDRVTYLDHRLTPEVRAMLVAMMSRAPIGGIQARYTEIVEAVSVQMWEEDNQQLLQDAGVSSFDEAAESDFVASDELGEDGGPTLLRDYARRTISEYTYSAEGRLTVYPLPQSVKKFFDLNVGEYGHSSVLELTGSPTVFIEGISVKAAYDTFESPLVRGQEMSTRAVWRKDWPMAFDCMGLPYMNEIHELGLQIAQAEVEAWKQERLKKCDKCRGDGTTCQECLGTGQKYPDFDPQGAFRFAFDRARWALPGTIATGVAHTADLRTMARVIKAMEETAKACKHELLGQLVSEIKEAYRQAMPGMSELGLKEAVYSEAQDSVQQPPLTLQDARGKSVCLYYRKVVDQWDLVVANPKARANRRSYADPYMNHHAKVYLRFQCSWACARDWHRHRTMYPWILRPLGRKSLIAIEPRYAPISNFGKAYALEYLHQCTRAFEAFAKEGNQHAAWCCLPLGAQVSMQTVGGLRDVLYMLELRGFTHGANFEYGEQARTALAILDEQIRLDGIAELLAVEK